MAKITRREFMKKASVGAVGAGLFLSGAKNLFFPDRIFAGESGRLEYRTLGRTGLKVTTIGFGAMRTDEAAVIRKAYDMGINYFDTADCYMNGNNEKIVGKALKGVRDKVIIATKVHNDASRKQMVESMERSLKSLGTDYIDIMQLHGKSSEEEVLDSDAIDLLSEFKRAGKIRFTGVTTHQNEAVVVDAAVKSGFYDMALVAYNFQSPGDITESFRRAAAAGVGIVAMKTQAGGYQTKETGGLGPHQAALRWVLEDKNVATTIPSMVSYEQLDENFAVMGTKLGWSDRKVLNRYASAIDKVYCRRCGKCEASCPKKADIPAMNRVLMYAEGYGDRRLASENFALAKGTETLAKCTDCAKCAAKCVNGLDIAGNLRKVQALFA